MTTQTDTENKLLLKVDRVMKGEDVTVGDETFSLANFVRHDLIFHCDRELQAAIINPDLFGYVLAKIRNQIFNEMRVAKASEELDLSWIVS